MTKPQRAQRDARERRGPPLRTAAILCLLCTLVLAGCTRKITLKPLPAARGGNVAVRVELTYNRNDQIQIEVRGPDPSAYGPAYTRYVVWIARPDGSQVTNAGQVRVENGQGQLLTLTPLRKFRLFVTVEEKGDALKPGPLLVFEAPKEIEW
jgi:hypothetical protein